ncbi:hypothetical protein [Mycolicibacterium phlei]|nr:hypothetical protein [Mycolicibacterium phlei]
MTAAISDITFGLVCPRCNWVYISTIWTKPGVCPWCEGEEGK